MCVSLTISRFQRKDVAGVSAGEKDATNNDADDSSDSGEKASDEANFGNKSQVLNLFTIDVDRWVATATGDYAG